MKIVGFDAGPAQVVEQVVKALDGEETTPQLGTDSVTITKDNRADSQHSLSKSSC